MSSKLQVFVEIHHIKKKAFFNMVVPLGTGPLKVHFLRARTDIDLSAPYPGQLCSVGGGLVQPVGAVDRYAVFLVAA